MGGAKKPLMHVALCYRILFEFGIHNSGCGYIITYLLYSVRSKCACWLFYLFTVKLYHFSSNDVNVTFVATFCYAYKNKLTQLNTQTII